MAEGDVVSGVIGRFNKLILEGGGNSMIGIKDSRTVNMSFETGEQTTTRVYFVYRVKVNSIKGIVMKAIAGTDDGTITAQNQSGSAMSGGVITASANDPLNTVYSVTPSTNNIIAEYGYMNLVSAKTTTGGKVMVTIETTRVDP